MNTKYGFERRASQTSNLTPSVKIQQTHLKSLWQLVRKTSFLSFLILFSLNALYAAPKTLVVCDDVTDPLTLDPQKEFAEKNHTLVQQMFDGLVRFTPDGKIEPSLAVSWERIDPLRVRFKLRKGVSFHNGEPFNSESVRFSIERYLDPKTGFPALGFITSLDKVEIIDDYTIDILTKFPDGLLLNRLAGFILISPPKYIAEKGEENFQANPIGTGPFRFEKWEKKKRVVMRKNQDYWAKGIPKVDRLIFKFIPSEKQVSELLSNNIDILTEMPGTRTTDVMENKTTKVIKRETFYTVVGSFNVSKGPLKDVRVRQAINYAINMDEIIRYDILGNGKEMATVTMPGEEGHNPKLRSYGHNPSKAKMLLKEAGYKDGVMLDVVVKEQGLRTAKIIQKQLERVGIRSKFKITTDATVVKDINSKNWDMFIAGCPDPMVHSFFIQSIFFYSKSPYSLGQDEKFDQLLEEMVTTLDIKDRIDKAKKIDKYVYDQALGAFTYQRIKTYGVNRNISFRPSVTGMTHFYIAEKK